MAEPTTGRPFDVRSCRTLREKKFKVYSRKALDELLGPLPDAAPDSYLDLRSFRGDVKRLTPTDTDLGHFLLERDQ